MDKPFYSDDNVAAFGTPGNSAGSGGGASGVTIDDIKAMGFAEQSWVTAQLGAYATQAWVNSQGFLKQHQSLAAYLTKTDAAATYVTALGTNGDYLTWTKNGVTNNITVPFATATNSLFARDTRNTDTLPNAFDRNLTFHLKRNATDGLDCGGTYHAVLNFAQWSDSTGGAAKQLALGDDGHMYLRHASLDATAWGAWRTVLDSGNYATTLDTRYVKKSGDTMTGALNVAVNGLTLKIGAQNSTGIHVYTSDATKPIYVNTGIQFVGNGDIGNAVSYRVGTVFANAINVTSTDLVSNLNADRVDGYHVGSLMRTLNGGSTATQSVDANSINQNALTHDYRWTNVPANTIASLLDITYSNDWRSQLFVRHTANTSLHVRSRYNGTTWGTWRELAFTDSNVASATKLQTARTIWGQSFDGTANVSGALSGVTNITMSG
ncbi:MAG: hypothetical protein K2K69_05850, partial [Muribaculaceae bacterium]|nr:hypothetical protein [Muribaculaceae bacterium]